MTINRSTAAALVLAAGYIAGALALKAAEKAGYLTHDTVVRFLAAITGLGLAVYANFLPKNIAKNLGLIRNELTAMRMQAAQRVSGWAFTLGGLAYAIASLLPVPDLVAPLLLGIATAYALGYFAWSIVECARRESRPAA